MKGYESKTRSKDETQRYVRPADNLIYAILLQAAIDNDIDFLKHGDGRTFWEYLKKQPQRG